MEECGAGRVLVVSSEDPPPGSISPPPGLLTDGAAVAESLAQGQLLGRPESCANGLDAAHKWAARLLNILMLHLLQAFSWIVTSILLGLKEDP